MKKDFILFFCLFFATTILFGQKTLYVDNFNNILGSPNKEDKLLLFAKKNNFRTLILYQLNKVDKRWSLTDPVKNNILSEFIAKAKNKFSIKNIGASGESASFFTETINPFNNTRKKNDEKIDIYNLEYEYWSKKASEEGGYYCEGYLRDNSKPCNRKGSFNFFLENLKEIKKLSENNIHDIQIEVNIGFYTLNEIKNIVKYSDRLIIQAYGKSPRVSYTSAKNSLTYLLKTNSKVKTSILFSTRMNHMGYWLKSHSMENSEKQFFKEMNRNNFNLKKSLNFDGFSYHTYSYLEKSISYYHYIRK